MTVDIAFQQAASQQGRHFEESCVMALRYAGFEIVEYRAKLDSIGVEVDFIVTSQKDISFYCTAKGSMRGERPGSKRTDTLKKALCDAFLLEQEGLSPVLLLTSHIPERGSGLAMLNSMRRDVLFDVLSPWAHGQRLAWLAKASDAELDADLRRLSMAKLVEKQWCAQ
jgi:hypothetical protein